MFDRLREIIIRVTAKVSMIITSPAKHQADFLIFLAASIVLLIILVLMMVLAYFLLVPPKYEVGIIEPVNRKRRAKIFKIKVAIYSILAVSLLAGLAIGDVKTTGSNFCVLCHKKLEYSTWKQSHHSGVTCVSCHADAGVTGFFSTKFRETRNLYMFVVYPNDLKYETDVKDRSCIECHRTDIKKSLPARGGFLMNHKGLIVGGFVCTDCHRETGHKTLGQTKAIARMEDCQRCHDGKAASDRCETCHQEEGIKVSDGNLAIRKIPIASKTCSACHANQASCKKCHYGYELPHQPQFISGGHKNYPAAQCFKCHTQGPAYCTQCHAAPTGSINANQ